MCERGRRRWRFAGRGIRRRGWSAARRSVRVVGRLRAAIGPDPRLRRPRRRCQGTRMSPPDKPSKTPPPKNRGERGKEPAANNTMRNWVAPILLALLLLWAVMSMQHFIAVKTITYSEFRGYVDRGEVVECKVSGDSIEGRIVRKGEEPKKDASKTDKSPP